MAEAEILDHVRAALDVCFRITLPLLAAALVTGLAIGLLQALTSVQEATLTFVPKLAAMLGTYWIAMGFMTGTLVAFFQDRILPAIRSP